MFWLLQGTVLYMALFSPAIFHKKHLTYAEQVRLGSVHYTFKWQQSWASHGYMLITQIQPYINYSIKGEHFKMIPFTRSQIIVNINESMMVKHDDRGPSLRY